MRCGKEYYILRARLTGMMGVEEGVGKDGKAPVEAETEKAVNKSAQWKRTCTIASQR